jgi:hypothetical protein
MSDRLDSRINAFVVELVDQPVDPPPFPIQDARPWEPDGRRRLPVWALAAVVFVAVVLFGLVALLLGEPEPAPVIDPDPQSVIDAFVAAVNAGDRESTLSLVSEDAACVAPGLPTCSDLVGFFIAADAHIVFTECSVNIAPYLQCQGYLYTSIHKALGMTESDLRAQPNFPPAFIVDQGAIAQFNFMTPFTGDTAADDAFWAYLQEIGADYLNDNGIPALSAEIVPRLVEDATAYAQQLDGG